jgi:UDP-glucose 4-epimerase
MPNILLTGATGYIGSHTWVLLEQAGFRVVGVDDHRNSSPRVLDRLVSLIGHAPVFERVDVSDAAAMVGVLARHRVDAAVHFAALKAVGESMSDPLTYFGNNIGGLVSTCNALRSAGVRRFVFSSSATVYGQTERQPIPEDTPLSATSPYGATKVMAEQILSDLGRSEASWQTGCLRYFNPVGAHESGLIGEDPRGVPNNLMPYVAQVAVGQRPRLQVFGNDYPTPDGTGVRDYIHVMDLAAGHVAALQQLLDHPGSFTVNLGSGSGHSVLELVRAYERASGRAIPFDLVARRPGDVAICVADPSRARAQLGWRTQRGLDDMCSDSWRWQRRNPKGFDGPLEP